MVELRPSSLKLNGEGNVPSLEEFNDKMCGIRHRFVNLTTRSDRNVKKWENTENNVVFELRSPTHSDLASLAVIVGKLKPNYIDYMDTCGEHCIVYTLSWGNDD